MPPVRREQGDRFESSVNTRQDRNLLLTNGGTWTWDPGAGELTWSQDLDIIVSNAGVVTLAADTATGLVVGTCFYVLLDRALGTVTSSGAAAVGDALLDADEAIVLGVRGADDRFYMRDGTVFAEGDASSLGTWSPSVDREVIVAGGTNTLSLVSMTYVYGTNQLLVSVGGLVQELGTHYEEVDLGDVSTDIVFYPDYIPSAGERVTCLTLTGGRGVSLFSSRQDAYTAGSDVLVVAAAPMSNTMSDGTDDSIVESWGQDGASADDKAHVRRDATWRARAFQIRDSSDHAESWEQVSLGGHLIFWNTDTGKAVRIRRGTGEVDFGTCDGTSFTITAQPAGGGVSGTQPGARVMCFSGTLDPTLPTHIPWSAGSLGVPYGIQILAYNAAPTIAKYMAGEMSGFATGGSEVIVLYDETNNRIVVSGSLTGNDVVGANYQGQPYRMTVFY